MCRWLAYSGAPLFLEELIFKPKHSLIDQSLSAFSGETTNGDGFGIAGSFALNDQWHLFGDYSTADLDFGVDLDQLKLGGGFHSPLSNNVDFVAEFSYVRIDASSGGFSVDDDGFGLSIGARGMAADRLGEALERQAGLGVSHRRADP